MKLWQSKHGAKCKISQQDLRAISKEIAQKYNPTTPNTAHDTPILVLMSVDPSHLYAYWNLSSGEIKRPKMTRQKQLTLRVYSIPELSESPFSVQLSFDINVNGRTNQQQIPLPIAATAYSAIIGEIFPDNSFHPLVTADTISVPRATPHDSFLISPLIPLLNKRLMSQVDQNYLLDDTFVLENFNNYGYDLTVYESLPNTTPPLLFQPLKTAKLNKQRNNFDSNNSALGRLLE